MNDIDQESLYLFDEMEQDIENFAQDPSVREVLAVGVDLQNYGSEIAKQLKIVEGESIEDYLRQVPTANQLNTEIMQCDNALAEIEKSLSQFKGSLSQLSSDICTLQTRSQAITIKLNNRKNLETLLGQYARDISLSREFINQIVNGVVGPRYVKWLNQLNHKLEIIKQDAFKSSAAAKETRIPLDRLRLKASDNVRKWLLSRIDHLRDHYGTDQVAVQTELLKSKYLFKFLKNNSPDVEQTIREYYVAIMSRIYLENFKMLAKRVFRKMNPISISQEMIFPVVQKGFFSSKRTISESTAFFEIRERHRILHEILSPPQPFGDDQYPVEAFMRSLYQTLIDTITAETVFASDFFDDPNIGMPIFSSTSRYMETFMTELIDKITDPIALIIFMRFAIVHQKEMVRRKISLLDAHFKCIQQKIASKLKTILTANRAAFTQNSENPSNLTIFTENKATAHLANSLTKRFAEFALSISLVNNKDTDEFTIQETQSLSQSMNQLLETISKSFSSEEMELIFLINNYFHIVNTLRDVEESVVLPIFDQYLNVTNMKFIELLLKNHFESLFSLVIDAFEKVDNDQPRKTNYNLSELEEIAVDFKARHTERIKSMIDTHLSKFGDFLNGKEIMKQIVKRLVIYWAKFYQLCTIVPKNGKSSQWISSLPTVGILVNEIQSITEKL
ncbi:Vps52 [Tritrichomonas foetus]|uniref:Vps52 n=1 Tax=Tritrichomonas foetus TaxID=1144522 RepID=A0A1J4KXK6_9EUKA|nr:Vps52 [Tritrichomonas foetus]|eukprot:OHT14436.1 Vps52 [Tritrichomonas foetus]